MCRSAKAGGFKDCKKKTRGSHFSLKRKGGRQGTSWKGQKRRIPSESRGIERPKIGGGLQTKITKSRLSGGESIRR